MPDLVTWNPRVGSTGDDRYHWSSDRGIEAGVAYPTAPVPDPVTVNTLTGLNQIHYEINRRLLLWETIGGLPHENDQNWGGKGYPAPTPWPPAGQAFFGRGGYGLPPLSKAPTSGTFFPYLTQTVASVINAWKEQIFWIEAVEGRPHTAFTVPVRQIVSPWHTLPGHRGAGWWGDADPVLERDLFEVRKALATDHIVVYPRRNRYAGFASQFITSHIVERNLGYCYYGDPYPCFDYELNYQTYIQDLTGGIVSVLTTGGGVDPRDYQVRLWDRILVNGALGFGRMSFGYRAVRRPLQFVLPSALPTITGAALRANYGRIDVYPEDEATTMDFVRCLDAGGGSGGTPGVGLVGPDVHPDIALPTDPECMWGKPMQLIASVPYDILPIGPLNPPGPDDTTTWLDLPASDLSWAIPNALVTGYFQIGAFTPQTKKTLPPQPPVGTQDATEEQYSSNMIFVATQEGTISPYYLKLFV